MSKYIKEALQLQNRIYSMMNTTVKWLKKPRNQRLLVGGGVLVTGVSGYVFKFDEKIEIKNKYVKIEGPRSLYMITSSNGKIYKCDYSSWKLHYVQAELWNSIEKGQRYHVKGFGVRWPFFAMYPNIHSVQKV